MRKISQCWKAKNGAVILMIPNARAETTTQLSVEIFFYQNVLCTNILTIFPRMLPKVKSRSHTLCHSIKYKQLYKNFNFRLNNEQIALNAKHIFIAPIQQMYNIIQHIDYLLRFTNRKCNPQKLIPLD